MPSRVELQTILENLLGSRNVYFQPPESLKLSYPAIVYNIKYVDVKNADDNTYTHTRCYQVILIDKNPDNIYFDKFFALPMCRCVSVYRQDNLNHYIFEIFY